MDHSLLVDQPCGASMKRRPRRDYPNPIYRPPNAAKCDRNEKSLPGILEEGDSTHTNGTLVPVPREPRQLECTWKSSLLASRGKACAEFHERQPVRKLHQRLCLLTFFRRQLSFQIVLVEQLREPAVERSGHFEASPVFRQIELDGNRSGHGVGAC